MAASLLPVEPDLTEQAAVASLECEHCRAGSAMRTRQRPFEHARASVVGEAADREVYRAKVREERRHRAFALVMPGSARIHRARALFERRERVERRTVTERL